MEKEKVGITTNPAHLERPRLGDSPHAPAVQGRAVGSGLKRDDASLADHLQELCLLLAALWDAFGSRDLLVEVADDLWEMCSQPGLELLRRNRLAASARRARIAARAA